MSELGLTPIMLSPLAWRAIIDCIRATQPADTELLALCANEIALRLDLAEELFSKYPGGVSFEVTVKC